jgi:type IV pilus assembly protein PilM
MNAVGFDLGSHSLKLIELAPDGKKFRPIHVDQFTHPFGVMIPQDMDQIQQLAAMIKKVLVEKKYATQNIRVALPESVVSTKIISTPTLSDAELASAIDWLAEQNIAIPLEELKIEYEVLYRPDKQKNENMRVMLVGVPKTVINAYMAFFDRLEIEPVILETQVLSILRSCTEENMPTTLFAHMGASSTDFFIVHQGEVVFVYSFNNGGRLITRSIERSLNVDAKQAEEYKLSYGVDPNFLEGKISKIIQPVLQLFVAEIQKAMQYFTSQYGTQTVKRIVLSGGSAHMPGLISAMSSQLGAECTIAHPFEKLVLDTKVPVPADREAAFSIAVGLAMRQL